MKADGKLYFLGARAHGGIRWLATNLRKANTDLKCKRWTPTAGGRTNHLFRGR